MQQVGTFYLWELFFLFPDHLDHVPGLLDLHHHLAVLLKEQHGTFLPEN